jgi:hypothetical protein
MKFSVIHPAARPQQLASAIAAWYRSCSSAPDAALPFEYIVCHHAEQAAEFARLAPSEALHARFAGSRRIVNAGPNHPTVNGRSSFVDNANCAAAASVGDVLVLATDDLEPPASWDALILQAIASRPDLPQRALKDGRRQPEAVLKCSNGDARSDARDLILHPVMTRARYERQGWVFHPAYSGMYSDNELTIRARIDGVVIEAPQVVFTHRHPDLGTAATDQVYLWQNSREEFARGMETLKARAALGFPHIGEERGPQPVTLYFGEAG